MWHMPTDDSAEPPRAEGPRQADPPPSTLRLGYEIMGDTVAMSYTTTGGDRGSVTVRYGFPLEGPLRGAMPGIALVAAVYLGQLALAPRLEPDFPVDAAMVEDILPLASMLYDIRRWKDGLPSGSPPEIGITAGHGSIRAPAPPIGAESVLLWSGGKDSSLSGLLLGQNGYRARALHFTANTGVEDAEVRAVGALADRLDLDPLTVSYAHPEFLSFSSRYAVNWNQPPLCNTVPFGRDLLLSALSLPVLAKMGVPLLSAGHDHECRNAYVEADGRRVPRNDVESLEGALAMERYLSRHVLDGLRLLPPVAGLSELRILQEMLMRHSEIMRDTAFCFWGGNCGRCAKCLRYYLAQRLFGVEVLWFRTNPLGEHGAPEMDDVLDLDRQGVLFQQQVLLCAARLVERDDIRRPEIRLQELARTVYPLVAEDLDAWERELLTEATDPQLPTGWRYPSAPPRCVDEAGSA